MASTRSATPRLLGSQVPSRWHAPANAHTSIAHVRRLCEMAGLVLDAWQAFVVERSLGLRPDGKWAAFQVGLCGPRQNGKNGILEAIELAGLFLLGDRLIIHSAHQWDTSLEAFGRLTALIEDCPDLKKRVKRISGTHGQEGITLLDGRRIRFRTRSKAGGGGRGFTCDRLIFDEAMELAEAVHGAVLPTLSARPNPQVWYTGSAVDEEVHADGHVFARLRERGHRGDDRVAWFEWCADGDDPATVDPEYAADPATWALANPALGIRIDEEYVEDERGSLAPRTFAVERLGIGKWPRLDDGDSPISVEAWKERAVPAAEAPEEFALAFDVKPDRSGSSIGRASWRDDGRLLVECVERFTGTAGLAERVAELVGDKLVELVCDGASPAASLIPEFEALGLTVTTTTATDMAAACGQLFDDVERGTLAHVGDPAIEGALRGASKRPIGDNAWAWSRKHSSVDISPLVAPTLAAWALRSAPEAAEPFLIVL